jgi:methylenetetrahydrofolate dehydrogenase (NADP+)/methenyltetrahydrofolate cyclohydrolase
MLLVGNGQLITRDPEFPYLKDGAVVIDVGVNRIPDAGKPKGFRLVGDADYESCEKVASAITPVPGGVGPMTITMLLWNTLESAKKRVRF